MNDDKLQIQKYENKIMNLDFKLKKETSKWKEVDKELNKKKSELEKKQLELTKAQESLKLYAQNSDHNSNNMIQINKLKEENALLKKQIHQLTNNEQEKIIQISNHQTFGGNTISTEKLLQQSKKQKFNVQTNIRDENMLVPVENTNLESCIRQLKVQIEEKNKKIQNLNISQSNYEKKNERILQMYLEEVQKRDNEIEQQKSTIFLLNHALENMTNHTKDLMVSENMNQKTYANKETIKNLQYQLNFSETTVAKLQTLVKIQAARIKAIVEKDMQDGKSISSSKDDNIRIVGEETFDNKKIVDTLKRSCSKCINCANLKKLEDLQIENAKILCKFEKHVAEIIFLRKNYQISEKNNKQIIVDLQTEIEALKQDKHTLESSADEVIELLNKSNEELRAKLDKLSR